MNMTNEARRFLTLRLSTPSRKQVCASGALALAVIIGFSSCKSASAPPVVKPGPNTVIYGDDTATKEQKELLDVVYPKSKNIIFIGKYSKSKVPHIKVGEYNATLIGHSFKVVKIISGRLKYEYVEVHPLVGSLTFKPIQDRKYTLTLNPSKITDKELGSLQSHRVLWISGDELQIWSGR